MKKIILGTLLCAASTTCIAPAFAAADFPQVSNAVASLSGMQIMLSMLLVMVLPCLGRGRKKTF